MLNNISWASYGIAISIIVVIYYVVILVKYYRLDLQKYIQQISGRRLSLEKANLISIENNPGSNYNNTFENDIDIFSQQLLSNLQSLVKTGASRKYPREELLLSIQLELQNHPELPDNLQWDSVNNLIISLCKNYCSIHLSREEVSALWIKRDELEHF